jgi:hypothetical protein
MVPGVRTEGLIPHGDERPSAVIGIRQAVCDAARDVVGYEVLTGDPDAPPASARFCARPAGGLHRRRPRSHRAASPPAYLTVAPALLLRLDLLPVAPDRVVLQLDAVAPMHDEVAAAVDRLSALGYVFAAVDPPTPDAVLSIPAIGLVRLDVAGSTQGRRLTAWACASLKPPAGSRPAGGCRGRPDSPARACRPAPRRDRPARADPSPEPSSHRPLRRR